MGIGQVTDLRRAELRQGITFARLCRRAIGAGDLGAAFRMHALASRALALARGFGGGSLTTCTGGLSRRLDDLGDRLETAIRYLTAPADASDLVEDIAAGVRVLETRDGVELPEGAAQERGRGIALSLLARFRFERIHQN